MCRAAGACWKQPTLRADSVLKTKAYRPRPERAARPHAPSRARRLRRGHPDLMVRGPWVLERFFRIENSLLQMAGSPLATSPRSTPTATFTSSTAARTSSNRPASGSARSTCNDEGMGAREPPRQPLLKPRPARPQRYVPSGRLTGRSRTCLRARRIHLNAPCQIARHGANMQVEAQSMRRTLDNMPLKSSGAERSTGSRTFAFDRVQMAIHVE